MTISQQLAAFSANLAHDDLPPAVVDKVKALILHGLFVGLASHAEGDVRIAHDLADASPDGPRLIGDGRRATVASAAFYTSVLIHARGQDDSYRMLTHPGAAILPVALALGEQADGRSFLTAVAAAFEVHCRLARDIVPSVQNHGFRASALFAGFGATIAAARLIGCSAAETAHALAFAVSYAFGCLETSRAGTREMVYQEPVAAQAAITAARLARAGVGGAPESIEGAAGFLQSFTGSSSGQLTGSFVGADRFDPASIAADLGSRWDLLDVTQKIYSTAGFNQPVIEMLGALARQEGLTPDCIAEVTIAMNEWETVYPSPRYPMPPSPKTSFGSTAYFAAQAIAAGGYPSTGRRLAYGGADDAEEPAWLRTLIDRITVVAADRPQYAPAATVRTTDGRVLETSMTGDEFKWDLATERGRLPALFAALPFGEDQAHRLIDAVASLETIGSIAEIVSLTLPSSA